MQRCGMGRTCSEVPFAAAVRALAALAAGFRSVAMKAAAEEGTPARRRICERPVMTVPEPEPSSRQTAGSWPLRHARSDASASRSRKVSSDGSYTSW